MPPKLQQNLTEICLERHLSLIENFVIDKDIGFTSDAAICRRIVTSLHSEVFDFGAPIIKIGQMPMGIIFVKERGITVLGIMETVRLLDFYE